MTSHQLVLGSGPKASKFTLSDTELVVERPADKKWPKAKTPIRNVLWAELSEGTFELSFLAKKRSKAPLSLLHVTGQVSDADKDKAALFADAVMSAAYAGLSPQRRLKVFVNPKSGPGKAVGRYHKKIEPIFKAARCKVDVTFTTHGRHAQEIVQKLPLDDFDAIVIMSGDGLIHEVFNGFAAHADPTRAFRIPLTPIPAGSGNGWAINLYGLQDAKDLSIAALNAIKGRSMTADLCSFTQNGQRHISFQTQCLGLMADIDLGTEHLRFMGGHRFVVGFIFEVFKHKQCPAKVFIKVAEQDKRRMVEGMRASMSEAQNAFSTTSSAPLPPSEGPALPDLKHTGSARVDDDGWLEFDKPFTFLYAGKSPYVSADYLAFPVALPNDGLIDVILQERDKRSTMLKALDGAEVGRAYWLESQHYFKAYAYRVEPQQPTGFLSIDGEAYPMAPFEVECHRSLGAFLSMYGSWQIDFEDELGAKKQK